MYLFDTDTLSHLLRREHSPSLLSRMARIPAEQQFTSAITVGEMVYGAERTSRREYLLAQFANQLWPTLQVLPFDHAAAEIYGRIRADLERAGTPLAEADLRIGAIALTRDLTVVTGNTYQFSRIPGLRVENWM